MALITFREARRLISETVESLQPESISLSKSAGLILAENVHSDANYPVNDISAMDGYAINAGDFEKNVSFPVAFEIPAGSNPGELEDGKAARIFTGAVIPNGADTVVEQEDAEVSEDGMVTLQRVSKGLNVRHRGEVIRDGQLLAKKGEIITPALIAALATGGNTTVKVFPRPSVSILVTGSELVQVGTKPERGQTVDSNGLMLSALAEQDGLPVTSLDRAGDSLEKHKSALSIACESADLVVTSGGVSVGDYDFVARAITESGGEILFHRVLLKPGKPILAARIGDTWIIGLPGNPISALVGWRLFVSPLAEMLMGCEGVFNRDSVLAELTDTVTNKGKRPVFLQGNLFLRDNRLKVADVSWKGSHDVVASGKANTLLFLESKAEVKAGESVLCYPNKWKELDYLMKND